MPLPRLLAARLASERRVGWLAVLGGGLLALAVQVAAPVGVPLYDGVVVVEPYRFLHPVGDQAGAPGSVSKAVVTQGGVPVIVAATTETPPQAQLIAQDGAFALTAGATGVQVSITAIEPPAPPPGATIAGNVYRFSLTDQAGSPLQAKSCEGCRSLLLRAPDGTGEATIKRYANGTWVDVDTDHAGTAGLYQSNVTVLGDYAVIVGGAAPPAAGVDPLVILGGGALAIWLVVLGVVIWSRTRPAPIPGTRRATGRPRIPSKRKPPRQPPPGRSS